MANSSFINKALGVSPYLELFVRRLYRSGYFRSFFSTHNKKRFKLESGKIDFSKIVDYLKGIGIKQGDIVIVHSSYFSFINSGLTPSKIVDELISLVGQSGTIVMPVIRKFKEGPSESESLTADISEIVFEYNVQKSRVWTGMISYSLMRKKGAVTSLFPLNSIAAYGAEAENMIKDELKGELPSPNGDNSSWKYCLDRNAWCISLGVDLANSLTMLHTFEDLNMDAWPKKDWYREKKFRIVDGDSIIEKKVLERHPKWGMLNYAERTLSKDLVEENIMESNSIEGVLIESLRSKDLYNFLLEKNRRKPGYPYYFWK